jgi:hypothetical protein
VTRAWEPNENNWEKVLRLLKYIRGMIYMPLILRVDILSVVKWWVNASFTTHENCYGHTGGMMSRGKCSLIGSSMKQKINTRSSTEVELVGANDMMPMMWTCYFIEVRGYKVNESILNQENLSAMLLASE